MALRGTLAARVLLALSAAIVPLILAESGARLLAPPPPPNAFPGLPENEIPDTELLWRNRPGFPADDVYGPIDADGFLRPAAPPVARPGEIRILSLGESTTFGFGLKWADTYSHLIEERLTAAGYEIRVLNAGTIGWSTFQSARYLELSIEQLHPDIVLFYHEVNDFLPTTLRGTTFRGAGLTDSQMAQVLKSRSWLNRLIVSSRFLTWLRLAAARAEALAIAREYATKNRKDVLSVGYLPYVSLPPTPPGGEKPWMANSNRLVRVPDPEREALLRRLIRTARRGGAQLILLHPAYTVSKPHRCLLTRLAEEEKVPWIEVEDVIQADAAASGRRRGDYFFAEDAFHASRLGHQTIARAIGDFLLAGGFLAAVRPDTSGR